MSDSKLNMNNLEDVRKSLNSRTLQVCVVGIGRIGLPTALSFAKSGLPTIGVDINEKLAAKYPYQRAYLPVNRLEDGTMWNW